MGCRVAGHVAWREVGGEVLVVDLSSKNLFGLNSSAGAVWKGIADGAEPGTCLESLLPPGAASTAVESVSRAVGEFVEELHALGLVAGAGPELGGPPAPPGSSGDFAFEPPRVAWREELRSFGQSCGLISGQGDPCDQFPSS